MMLNLRETANALNAELAGNGGIAFERVTTDSRDIRDGDLFVALKGEKFDGHDYIEAALEKGAVAALASEPGAGNRILVADTLKALGQLAAFWRSRFTATPIIGVTGSNGKTTVKEMIASILALDAGADAVHATRGNLNNHIGLPLTLLALRASHRFAVVEMGMSDFGEIDYLTRIAQPDLAVITNAGAAHLEQLGSVEGVARAKGEIFTGLRPDGCAIINADDAHAALWAQLAAGHRQQTFGLHAAEVRANHIKATDAGHDFLLEVPKHDIHVSLAVPGLHNVRNATAAAAVAFELGLALETIAAGLEAYRGVKGRLEAKTAFNGAALIDDTYNANPDSMRAAVDVLAAKGGKTVLVLGDMGEVGNDAPLRHFEIGAYAKEKGIGALYTLGTHMAEAARAYGCTHYLSLDELVAALRAGISADATVLVKGSRFMQMERVVKALQE